MAAIATITGTAIRPGISKNNRKYTAEAIGRAAARAQARIDGGGMPLTMLTHHGADDDSTRIVGRITSMSHEADGSARYTAEIADTAHARDILSLVSGETPALAGVSIRGAWVGRVRRENDPDAGMVETGDDLELDGLDFTRKPGVEGAGIDTVAPTGAEPRESDGAARIPISESAPEATVTITEADDTTDGGPFADPGYQADKEKRYDLSTKAKAKAAWSYISQADNARMYTSAQLKRVKGRIVKALKGFGVTVATAEGWLIDPAAQLTESLAECWGMDSSTPGSLYLSLTNGPTTVSISSSILDPHDLGLVGRAAMAGACDALLALDPDMDADIDVPGADAEDTDGDMETAQSPDPIESAPTTSAPEPPAADPVQEEEPAMAESIPTTPAASPGVHLTDDQFKALLAAITPQAIPAAAPVEAAPVPTPAAVEAAPAAAPAVEAAPAAAPVVAESADERMGRLIAEGIAAALPAAVQEHVEQNGPPARKGLVAQVTEHSAQVTPGLPDGAPAKPLHEYTDEEWRAHISPVTVSAVLGDRANT